MTAIHHMTRHRTRGRVTKRGKSYAKRFSPLWEVDDEWFAFVSEYLASREEGLALEPGHCTEAAASSRQIMSTDLRHLILKVTAEASRLDLDLLDDKVYSRLQSTAPQQCGPGLSPSP
jgi:hypothetical protein